MGPYGNILDFENENFEEEDTFMPNLQMYDTFAFQKKSFENIINPQNYKLRNLSLHFQMIRFQQFTFPSMAGF